MNDIYFIAYFILIIGIISDLLPKINKIFKIYTTEPILVNEYSKDTIIVNIYSFSFQILVFHYKFELFIQNSSFSFKFYFPFQIHSI